MAMKIGVRRVGGGYQANALRGNTSFNGRSAATQAGARMKLRQDMGLNAATRGGTRTAGPGGGQ